MCASWMCVEMEFHGETGMSSYSLVLFSLIIPVRNRRGAPTYTHLCETAFSPYLHLNSELDLSFAVGSHDTSPVRLDRIPVSRENHKAGNLRKATNFEINISPRKKLGSAGF